jgi:hypothetical protein
MSDQLRAHTRAGAKAEARKLVAMADEDERRRIADRRKGDRRATDRTRILVLPPLDCQSGGTYADMVEDVTEHADEPETEEE